MKKRHLLKTMLLLFALIVGSSSVWADDVTDVLNQGLTGVTGTSYTEWTGKTSNSDAVYAGQSAGGNSSIQLRSSNNNSGIVTTASGGKVKKITVTWNSNTQSGRTLNVYGKNSAYSVAADLYDTSKQGTLLGTIVYGTSTELTVTGDYEYIGFRSASGAMYLTSVSIVWETSSGSQTATATSVTIDASGITNTNVYEGTAAGSLTATVKAGDAAIDGATVTWTSSNESVATIDANGAVTLVAAGTTTITASYAGVEGEYKSSSATYELTVTNSDPNQPGSENKPYTVAEARAAIDANSGVAGVYATGIVSEIVTAYNSQYGNISYNISADGTTVSDQLQAYRGKSYNGDDFTSADDIQVGDIVVVYGDLTKYGNTYEFAQGNQLVSLERPAASPVITSVDNVKLAANATSGEIAYKVEHPVEGTTLTAVVSENWISDIQVTDEKVTFATSVNTNTTARSAVMTLKYEGAEDKAVTITQAAPVNDYAELPFEFDGGSSAIESTSGLSAEGLGDYNNSPKLKFDGTGDYLLLQFNETPGTLTFDIKGNSFSGGTFTVQTSVDGVTFTDLESYTELGTTQSEKFDNLAADVRYIKWIYTEKSSGNVALGNIKLAKPDNTPSISVASTSAEVDADGGDGVIVVTYKNVDAEGVEVKWVESDGTTAAEYDWILADLENDNNLYYVVTPNDGAERKAYLKLCFDAETNEVCSDLITITQAAYEAPFEGATYTLASTITPGKHYIIASEADAEGNAYAMGEQNNNNRKAVAIKVDGDKAQVNSADVCEFVISIPADDGLYAIFDETEGGYLYAASSGSNYLRTETTLDDNGKWTIEFAEGVATIKAQGTNTHCWMQYNSSSTLFACYLEDKPQADVYLYEKDEDKTTVVTISELGYATFGSAEAVDFSETNLTVYTAKVNDTNSEVELTEVSSKQVPAGEAVLLKGEAGTYTGKVIESADRLTDNDLKLATADRTGNGKIYVLNKVDDKVGFYKLSAEGTLSKGKAYLESESAAPFLGFDGEDTTGINSVERGTLSVEGCYTLDGRRVAQPTKGLYIVNGKKVVIK